MNFKKSILIYFLGLSAIFFGQEPLKVFQGHLLKVNSVVYSPDGNYIASASSDNTIKVWNVLTGQEVNTLMGHSDNVYSVAFSPDGKYLVSGSADQTIKRWKLPSGECVNTFKGHTDFVSTVVYSPDGENIFSGSWDKTIKIWNIKSGQCINTLPGHTDHILTISISQDGKKIASCSEDKTVKLWDVQTGQNTGTLKGPSGNIYSAAFSQDGKFVVSGSEDHLVKLWAAVGGDCIKTFTGHFDYISSVAFSPDGKNILSGSYDKTIKLWDIASGHCVNTFSDHSDHVLSVAISPDGKQFVSASQDKTVKLWEMIKSPVVTDLTEKIKSKVEKQMNEWQQKGEFEKTSEYKARMQEQNRNKKIEEFQAEAINDLKKQFAQNINPKGIKLNTYDADNECFLLSSTQLGEFIVPVPRSEAPVFKQNFSTVEFRNFDFFIKDNHFVISHVDVNMQQKNKKYAFDSKNKTMYAKTVIDYKFNDIRIVLENKSHESNSRIQKTSNVISVGKSDVDVDIPVASKEKKNVYCLIIGNEDYSSFQKELNTEINVDYAINDAAVFREYCVKTLGVPEKQVKYIANATTGQMNQGIAWLSNLARVEDGRAELIFYYSGHGLPDENTKEPYLMPVDVSGNNITHGIKLDDIYKKINDYPSRKVTVFLDACFSGGARNQGLVAMKGVKVKPKESAIGGNTLVFASSTGEESSGVYKEKQHGYMTYFLLKKLQESKGDITCGELLKYVVDNVKKESALNGKIQTPQINVSPVIANKWEEWKLY